MITNQSNIPLPMALYCVHSDYDLVPGEDYISVTGLLKPIRAIVLSILDKTSKPTDVLDLVASANGTANHERLETSIREYKINMAKLGIPQKVIDKMRINPEKAEPNTLPIYLEKRSIKSLNGFRIGGKYDICWDGTIMDMKNVKAFSYIKNDNTDYQLQLSIYRWLNQDIVTNDIGTILMAITDWKEHETVKPDYPQLPIVEKKIPLLSIEETEQWITNKLNAIQAQINNPNTLSQCTREELWQTDDTWAYFKNPTAKRATKVFDNSIDASNRLRADGSGGKIDHRPGQVKRCTYCNAAPACTQREQLQLQGLI